MFRYNSSGTIRCVERTTRLYEQGADQVRIGDYVRRWCVWVRNGLDDLELQVVTPSPYAAAGKMPLRVPVVLSPGS